MSPTKNADANLTMNSHPMADIYQHWVLDWVVELALAVSHDFLKRPRHYRQVSESVANILSSFRSFTGTNPDWPNSIQRATIFRSLLGASFCGAGAGIRYAAIAFSEKAPEERHDTLRHAFLDSRITLRAHLSTLEGRVLSIGHSQTKSIFEVATEVFRSPEIAQVFGLSPAPKGDWPRNAVFSGDGAYLIEEVTRTLRPSAARTITQQKFIVLQQAAHYGALTIAGAMDETYSRNNKEQVPLHIQNAYSWAKALQGLLPNTIQAWKDPVYRQSLTNVEQSLVPDHPAGQIDLTSCPDLDVARTRFAANQTYTASGEICCCNSQGLCDTVSPICDDPLPDLPSLTGWCSLSCF